MSSDQRPGKVRVFSSQAPETPPARRRGDRQQAAASVAAASPAPAEAAARPARTVLLAVPFLLGCAIGGGVIAWLGLMPGGAS